MMRLLYVAAGVSLLAAPAWSQSLDDLKKAPMAPGSIVTFGLGYGLQRHSDLDQINKGNVKRLVPVWNYSLADMRGQESQPVIYNGVMYVTTHNATIALDAASGKQIWKTAIKYPPETPRIACCGIVNRGAAIYNGKVFRGTLDAHVIALDAKTGKELWRQKAIDFKTGYSITVAPLVANGVVITGISGGEYGTRGFIDGWDPETGKHLWRRYTIPAPNEPGGKTWPGDTWKHGGGATWLTGSYDPELDLVYWGVGNPGPWNSIIRKGDNLYTNSVLALRPKTGEVVWHYQFTPNDPFDYDGVNELVHGDVTIGGTTHKAIMQANRNGFLYVIDRKSGKLLAANPYVKVTWAKGIDMKTGRPIDSEVTTKVRMGEKQEVWPSAFGGKNWSPMSFDQERNLLFANTLNFGWTYKAADAQYRAGTFYFGAEFGWAYPKDEPRGYLKAIDPTTGKAKWEAASDIPRFAGVLSTKGGLVFTGRLTGEFEAFDADTGKQLWSFQTGSGIIGQPISWSKDGRQYITVANGIGGVYVLFSGDTRLAAVPAGGSVWTFALLSE